eukprot:4154706-Prorocentrum_lima.AAC.1
MTSSLVGSEMCIRDRTKAKCCQAPGALGTPAAVLQKRRQRIYFHASQAVSYTHLTLPTICSV